MGPMASMRNRFSGVWLGAGLAVFAVGVLASCNDHRLEGLRGLSSRVDDVREPERNKLDVLWVIDNSSSMCQEQANLARNFQAFADSLAELDVDIRLGVVTTDVTDPEQSGRLQNTPAGSHHPSCDSACDTDAQCGGGCLCGVPRVARCEADGECDAGELCAAAAQGGIRHCAPPCDNVGVDTCGSLVGRRQVLTCQPHASATAAGVAGVCLMTRCAEDSDCNGGDGQRCMTAADGFAYCRQADSQCPPPTCDCPKDLPTYLDSRLAGDDLERDFRCIASVGTQGAPAEKGLEAMGKALSPVMVGAGGPNAGFLRDEAHLLVAFLTDEDDCSDALQTCDAPGELCRVCPDDAPCRGLTGDDSMICREDAIDGVSWCRFPGTSAHECGQLEDYLVPVDRYADVLRGLKGPDQKVFVAGIVGPAGDGDGDEPTCASASGVAFSSSRYLELIDSFGAAGVFESICAEDRDDGELTSALEEIAERLVGGIGGEPACLRHALRTCRSGSDCQSPAACIDPGGPSPYCGDPASALPAEARVQILGVAGAETTPSTPEVAFVPGDGPAGHGCFRFLDGGPGPGEAARILYRGDLVTTR